MLTDKHKSIIDYVITYVGNSSNDWFRIKMEIINNFPSKERSNFSRRHYSTKKHILNFFDKEVIKYWEEQTGIILFIDPNKLHPENWVRKKRGWWLKELHEKQRKDKKTNRKIYRRNPS